MDKQKVLTFWQTFSDELDKPVSAPDLSVLDQVANYFTPGSYYYYILNFPKFKMEFVSPDYEKLTGLPSQTGFAIKNWTNS
jgi:hypothetical protein